MRQYSVLLVDDEEDVLQVIIKKLDWENMGFKIVGYAKNGIEALEMAEDLQPDVVMTDIKMPYMDGLTLCKELKELYQKVKVIIFSGFDDFEYAKEAIKNEAEEYILKPINSNELSEVFIRIKNVLDKELDEKRNIDKLRSYYMESLPILQENFYTSLIEGRIPEDQIEKYVQNYQIDLKGPYYVITILHISTDNSQQDNPSINPFLKAVSVKKLTEEQLFAEWKCKTVTYLGDIIVITQLTDVNSITRFTDTMDKICKMAKRVCDARVTAGIGHVCSEMSQLQLSFQGAQNAVSYRIIYGNTRAINIAEMDPQENVYVPWEASYIQKILKKIKMGEYLALENIIDEFIQQLSISKVSLQKFRILIMGLITEIFKFGSDNQLDMEKVFSESNDVYSQTLQLESPEALGRWLRDSCGKMQNLVRSGRQDTTKSFVTKAVEYVREHYADNDLSIEIICSYLNVSAAYFSTVFKKETGKTFINYLTEYRMQQAVNLLDTKDEKTYIIADQVGYADPNYFSYVFKKQFGMSPSKYKTNKTGES